MAKKRRGNRYTRQARLEAKVRFGPEASALRELLREAGSDLQTSLAAEQGAAAGIKAASRAARPEIRRSYEQAGRSHTEADQDVGKALAGLSAQADPYRAVSARESAGAKRRLAESMAGAEKELSDRTVQAEHGRQFGVRQAISRYSEDVRKVRGRQTALAGESGAFKLATIKDLQDADAKANQAEREFQLSLQKAEDANRNAAAGREVTMRGQDLANERAKAKAKGGKKKFTTVQLRDARDKYRRAFVLAERAKVKEKDGNDFVAFLLDKKGIPEAIARAAVQTSIFGGARPGTRRQVERNYGLKPKVMRPRPKRHPAKFPNPW